MARLQRCVESAVLVEDIGDAARHAGREVTAGAAEHDHDAASHVFAAMVAAPSITAMAPELRTAKRSPATPRKKHSPSIAPYSTVLPTMIEFSALMPASAVGRTMMRPPESPLPT